MKISAQDIAVGINIKILFQTNGFPKKHLGKSIAARKQSVFFGVRGGKKSSIFLIFYLTPDPETETVSGNRYAWEYTIY